MALFSVGHEVDSGGDMNWCFGFRMLICCNVFSILQGTETYITSL